MCCNTEKHRVKLKTSTVVSPLAMQQWRKHPVSLRLTLVLSVYRAVASIACLSWCGFNPADRRALFRPGDTRSGRRRRTEWTAVPDRCRRIPSRAW